MDTKSCDNTLKQVASAMPENKSYKIQVVSFKKPNSQRKQGLGRTKKVQGDLKLHCLATEMGNSNST
jgi:hypothetical protein